jgi:Kef-type K+ transport system membrane component KefB
MTAYTIFFIIILSLIFSPICVWIIDYIIDLIKKQKEMNILSTIIIIIAAIIIFNLLCVLILWLHFLYMNKKHKEELYECERE